MAGSKITIDFNMWLDIGEWITWDTAIDGVLSSTSMVETWSDWRSQNYIVYRGNPNTMSVSETAANFVTAFNLDYNTTGQYIVTQPTLTQVVIESTIDGLEFINPSQSTPATQLSVENVPLGDIYAIDSVVFAAGSNCQNIDITMNTNQDTVFLAANGTEIPASGQSTSWDWPRGQVGSATVTLFARNALAEIAIETFRLPLELKSSQISVAVTNTPSGANVSITHPSDGGQVLEYSIDGTNWFPTGTFNGIAPATYDAYVRDQYGCQAQKQFTIDSFTGNITELTPQFDISPINSIRFKRSEEWDYCDIFKNDENTLSFEEEYEAVYCDYKQKFQTCDKVTTQVRSNYDSLTVSIHDGDSETNVLAVKKSDNIQRKDMRDGNVYYIDENFVGVYFTSGDTYDYDTQIVNGTYELNGNLPSWAEIDLWVFIDTLGWLQIVDIVRNDEDTAWVLKFSFPNAQPVPFTAKISTIYDARNFETYEFDIDFNSYAGKQIQVKVEATDAEYGTKEALSEIIDVQERHAGTVAIKYSHSQNTGTMNYSYGIVNFIRVTGKLKAYKPDGEKDIHRTDSATVPILAKLYQDFQLDVHAEPTAMAQKVALAVSHDKLEINGVSYVTKEVPETEQLGEQINLYSINAKVTKAGVVFTDDTTPSTTQSELIGLLEDNGDYFKIN